MIAQPNVAVSSNEVPPATTKIDRHITHDQWDENWYALLAEFHVQEQRKKNKWHGENDGNDWLAEFEKLALLELRK